MSTHTHTHNKRQRVLIVEDAGGVYAVSNKCSHLGLPIQGKTAMFTAQVKDGCVVCPAHGTAFALADGAVKGEWCPKVRAARHAAAREGGDARARRSAFRGEGAAPAAIGCIVSTTNRRQHKHDHQKPHNNDMHTPQFPQLPLVGKLGDKKPLPTFQVRVSDAGDIEVDV